MPLTGRTQDRPHGPEFQAHLATYNSFVRGVLVFVAIIGFTLLVLDRVIVM